MYMIWFRVHGNACVYQKQKTIPTITITTTRQKAATILNKHKQRNTTKTNNSNILEGLLFSVLRGNKIKISIKIGVFGLFCLFLIVVMFW